MSNASFTLSVKLHNRAVLECDYRRLALEPAGGIEPPSAEYNSAALIIELHRPDKSENDTISIEDRR